MKRRSHAKRGALYVMALYVTSLIALSIMVNMTQVVTQIRSAERYVDQLQSFHVAEAGLDAALAEFTSGGSDFLQAEGWADADQEQCAAGTPCLLTLQLMGTTATATVTVNDMSSTEPVITSQGTTGGVAQNVEVVLDIPPPSPFKWPLFAEDSITLQGTSDPTPEGVLVDSYNSDLGAYGDALDPADDTYGTINQSNGDTTSSWNGTIRTNSEDENTVTVGAGSTVYGDAVVGPDGVPSVVIDAAAGTIQGDQEAAGSTYTLDPVALPPGSPSGSAYTVPNGTTATVDISTCGCSSITMGQASTLTLTGSGELHLSSIDIDKTSTFRVDGSDVTLVLDSISVAKDSAFTSNGDTLTIYGTGVGSFAFEKDGLVNATGTPRGMQLYLKGTNPLTIAKDSTFYGAIYAPEASVTVAMDSKVFGSIVAKSITVAKNSAVHYDDSLADDSGSGGGGGSTVTVKSWRQY